MSITPLPSLDTVCHWHFNTCNAPHALTDDHVISSHVSSQQASRGLTDDSWDLRAPGPIQSWGAGLVSGVRSRPCWSVIGHLLPVLTPDWLAQASVVCFLTSDWLTLTRVIIWSGELMASSRSYFGGSSVMIHAREWNKVFQEIEIILKRIRQKVPWIFLSHEQNLFKLRVILKARIQTHFLRWDTKQCE